MAAARVDIKVQGSGDKVAAGSAEMLGRIFEAAGLEGPFTLTAGAAVHGNPHTQGIVEATVKPGATTTAILFTIQPGGNGTRREFRLDVPASERTRTIDVLRTAIQALADSETEGGKETDSGRSIQVIKADIERKRLELEGFPAFLEQEKAISAEERSIAELEASLVERRRALDQRKAGLRQEISAVQQRRRGLEEKIEFLDLELEEANMKLGVEARAKAEAVAESMGLTYDEFVALIGRKP